MGRGGGLFLKSPPIAAHCSPLLHGNFSQRVVPQMSPHFSPLQPTLTWRFFSGVILQKSSHCSPLFNSNSSQGVIPQNSSHCIPLQPTLTWQFWSAGGGGVIPQKSSLCSERSPLFYGNFSQGGCSNCSPLFNSNSSQGVIPQRIPPIAAHSYTAILVGGGGGGGNYMAILVRG